MARTELIMPKMGESIIEATILNWVKSVGDTVEEDETILEIATDKVDSEIPSPVSGIVVEILFPKDTVVAVGTVIAIIDTDGDATPSTVSEPAIVAPAIPEPVQPEPSKPIEKVEQTLNVAKAATSTPIVNQSGSARFYSPLVKSIAQQEGIGQVELDTVAGTGASGRVTKQDLLDYIASRSSAKSIPAQPSPMTASSQATFTSSPSTPSPTANISSSGNDEIIEMGRMRKLIADHMVMSKHTSPHVTSFIEVDVTNIVNWRNGIKESFKKEYGENITFTPIFMEAVAKALKDFPMVNVSVSGDNIIVKKNINIGMAAALPTGNLIVPVIKNADYLNLAGLTKSVNDLANRARNNKLKPEDIQDGTFTLTNVGTFGNVMGTPIINQPQVAILAVGAIRKKPAVIETEFGDLIAVRQLMFCSLSYDHRVVDGFLGGSFLRRFGDYLEAFDPNRTL
jgi:2-oxoglutarate dehydrogenase E2 component (dihydrolipoamide succinyltransferase)